MPFNDLGLTGTEIREEIETAIGRVLSSGRFILGPELEAFEREFAGSLGFGSAVGVGNGTDAITLA
ncbi:MAG: DegT/DnrJ/EryC1/StrS family aminotransferase, partial [Vicinamibacteria bacterium]